MKKLSILALMGVLCAAVNAQEKPKYLIECESFPFKAMWESMNKDGQKGLSTEAVDATPTAIVDIPAEGLYNVWACSYDYEKEAPKSRRFKVIINNSELPGIGGTHGTQGWDWQNLGKAELKKGSNIVTLKRAGFFPRVDALIFAMDDKYKPNRKALSSRGSRKGFTISATGADNVKIVSAFSNVKETAAVPNGKKVGIQNKVAKLLFTEVQDSSGVKTYQRSIELLKDGKWVAVPAFKDELFFVGYEPENPGYNDNGYFSAWKNTPPAANVEICFDDGTKMDLPVDVIYPYAPSKIDILRPKAVERISPTKLKLIYSELFSATMQFVDDSSPTIKFETSFKAPKDGFYTVGMLGFNSFEKGSVSATQMPPLFQMRMMMETPKMLGNRFTSQPLALLQSNMAGEFPISYAVVADPARLPKEEWSWKGNSLYGFSLASPINKVQPAIFYPILGGRNSEKKAGEEISASWYLMTVAGKWYDALAITNEKVLPAGKIFREPFETSLSDAAANIATYLKDFDASGWVPKLKGRWNIEDKDLVTNATPLTEISVAILTDDEDYYRKISLPVIEYSLTRQSSHFSPHKEPSPYSQTPYAMKVPSTMWKADYYAGMNKLLGNSNTWCEEFWKSASNANMYSSMPDWTSVLGLYLANPSPELLQKAKDLCDKWLLGAFIQTPDGELDYSGFANVSFYPYWWYLPDMYEITGDKKYLDYAERGAFHSLAALWSYPEPSEGIIKINKGNTIRGIGHIWWKGPVKYRLGMPLQEAAKSFITDRKKDLLWGPHDGTYILPEHDGSAIKVSRIGLGMEQPSTFRAGGEGHDFNILMPSWAPEMLKVYQYTNRDILLKYSRHTMVGRFANFLGYYICDFTDVQHDPLYPYSGPDITSFYYHHAPCHFAQTYDYLVAQFEVASKGKVKFPYVRQQGYVWFTDRIFGMPGKIFDEEKCKPVLDKEAVRPDSPKVNVLTARAENAIWVLLLNDSAAEIETKVAFNPQSKLMQGANLETPADIYDASGAKICQTGFYEEKPLKIAAQTMVAVKIPAVHKDIAPAQPAMTAGGHVVKQKASADFGDLHAFRIRGPFGKDSLYVILTEGVEKKAKLTVEVTAPFKQTLTCDEFPFEVTLYPLPMDKDLSFTVKVQEDGKALQDLGSYEIKK